MQLTTSRSTLTLAQPSDFKELHSMYTEPDTWKYIKHLQNRTEREYHQFLLSRIALEVEKKGYYWVARLQENNELIGAMNLTPFRDSGILQIGFQIRQKFWNQGFAFELAQAVLEFAIKEVGLKELYAFYESENIASGKILKKLGFQFKERRQFDIDDVPLEVMVYRV